MNGYDQVADIAAAALRFRRYRSHVFSAEMFGEPAWDLLLELFVADANGIRLTGRNVAEHNSLSPSVVSRWLKYLDAEGLIVGDGSGDLDDELTLSGAGMEKMETALNELRFIKDQFSPQSRMAG